MNASNLTIDLSALTKCVFPLAMQYFIPILLPPDSVWIKSVVRHCKRDREKLYNERKVQDKIRSQYAAGQITFSLYIRIIQFNLFCKFIIGNFWFRQRRLITPSFHFKILNEFHLIMNKGVNALITKLNKFADTDEAFDAQHISNLATLDVICGKKKC